MTLFRILPVAFFVATTFACAASSPSWNLAEDGGIVWDVKAGEVAHKDHIEMAGRSVDVILEWEIRADGSFRCNRKVRWPMLRTLPDNTHASLQMDLEEEDDPVPVVDGKPLPPGQVRQVAIHGRLRVTTRHGDNVEIERTIFPCVDAPVVVDWFRMKNIGQESIDVVLPEWRVKNATDPKRGLFGSYFVDQVLIGAGRFRVAPGQSLEYALSHSAYKHEDAPPWIAPDAELAARDAFVCSFEQNLVLECPDPVLVRLFSFSKVRATESIFSTRGGLMHAPGGYNKYLAAIWANDQAEYVNPFFPFLGDPAGNESAMNSYRHFARFMNDEYRPIPSSIIAEGRDIWNGAGDRGDAAMIAYGASRFALASGNPKWARELWPLVEWCLEYCRRNLTPDGVVASDTDELEGRFPAGKANLCTSSLYYDALRSAAVLARALGKDASVSKTHLQQAAALRKAIAKHFEAEVEGFQTYRYYDGNTALRSWICVPLTVGIDDRLKSTADALFSPKLWTENGLLTKSGTKTVWDRSTLYALRGVIACGEVERGMEKLREFSRQRLLGDHVPYVIEAYPESNQSHLSAESGLYCRIFTEGIFGIRPTGLDSFQCIPRLPKGWPSMALRRVHAFGRDWDIEVSRVGGGVKVKVACPAGGVTYEKTLPEGQAHSVKFPE